MREMTYVLTFNGYWRAPNIGGLPASSGVYGVYACTFNPYADTVSLDRLLYIGEAGNVRDRVACHERWHDWALRLQPGEELCFNAAPIAPALARQRAEAAMIHHHKPPCNVEYVHSLPFDETTILASGDMALMTPIFTVLPSPADTLAALLGVMARKRL